MKLHVFNVNGMGVRLSEIKSLFQNFSNYSAEDIVNSVVI